MADYTHADDGKQIRLTNSDKHAIVDDIDYVEVSKFNWYITAQGYAANHTGGYRTMHQLINRTPSGYETDHKNRNKLDNRRCNLRTATTAQNNANSPAQANSKSGLRGVCWSSKMNRWRAYINFQGKRHDLGVFETVDQAVATREAAFKHYYGEFALVDSKIVSAFEPNEKLRRLLRRSNSTTGHKYIHWYKSRGNYMVSYRKDGRGHFIGYFKTLEDAIIARNEALGVQL
jgi:hypothetical protein